MAQVEQAGAVPREKKSCAGPKLQNRSRNEKLMTKNAKCNNSRIAILALLVP